MNTFTDEDLTILESLEFEPPCEHSQHETRGGQGPARWIVFSVPVAPCGCPLPPVCLWCDPCKNRIILAPRLRCADCGALRAEKTILRIEPLR